MEPQAPIRQKIIREIKPSPVLQARTRNHKLRVAAYCRVSTEQEEQQTSIENQITYYDDLSGNMLAFFQTMASAEPEMRTAPVLWK